MFHREVTGVFQVLIATIMLLIQIETSMIVNIKIGIKHLHKFLYKT